MNFLRERLQYDWKQIRFYGYAEKKNANGIIGGERADRFNLG